MWRVLLAYGLPFISSPRHALSLFTGLQYGRGHFTTEKKHYTIIDAPGHKSFVPNMISGAVQADVGVLVGVFGLVESLGALHAISKCLSTLSSQVISARKGEFETGFERGGQTREHAMLAKTVGVLHLVVVINKMDDPTVNWDVERYNECKEKLEVFLQQTGFKKTGESMKKIEVAVR